MARSSVTAASPHAQTDAASHKRLAVESSAEGGGNNSLLSMAPSPELQRPQEAQQLVAERQPRNSKRRPDVDALSGAEAAFVLDGERFYDAMDIGDEDPSASGGYWGMQVDDETQTPYYFNHLRPEELQWLPPAELIRPDTQEVTLWDANAQWFYLHNPQTQTSRWLEDDTNNALQQQ